MTELPEREDFGDYGQWPGRAVLDPSGRRLGDVREIYLDDATDRPEWVLVEIGDEGRRFVPLAGATVEGEAIRVMPASERVEAAPSLEAHTELTRAEERRLYDHYGLRSSDEESDSLLPDSEQQPPALAATPPADEEPDHPRPVAPAPPAP
ncbi:MAG: PRC-barrel domain-containing protein, partial [Solirubrobacteraceae bacterium]